VDIGGSHYSKADMLKWREHPSEYVSNHMNGVEIRFSGDTAVAQGSESWKKKDGTTGMLCGPTHGFGVPANSRS
jgi:hypothetical protein